MEELIAISFASAVRQAADRIDVQDAIFEIYRSLQSQIDSRRPICQKSGRCCRFDEFGHRLYVTTAEMGAFMREKIKNPTYSCGTSKGRLAVVGGCPFQVDGLCGVHQIRPFGCRIFFCDETSMDWQREQYEIFHREIKQVHHRLGIAYFYVEWREALAAITKMQLEV